MKVLFICGVYEKENESEIIKHAKQPIEFSANIFQEKLINGFIRCSCDVSVLSAPFIGSFPNASTIISFCGFKNDDLKYEYVNFNNIWGFRNFSRASALKHKIQSFINDNNMQKLIIVYSPHTPFLEAAVYAKSKDPKIKICLIVPDLPEYMNLNTKVSKIYKICKKFDIAKFKKLNYYVDSYMLLTKAMTEKLDVSNKPYIVVEGIIDREVINEVNNYITNIKNNFNDEIKYVVYTGKLNEKFGIKILIDAFMMIKGPEYRLILCGKGDAEEYARYKSLEDNRIVYMGQVTPDEAKKWMFRACVLVNPRLNNEEYTKYSFPSKVIEYLLSGKPVVAYMLDGMPEIYKELLHEIKDNRLQTLADTIVNASNISSEVIRKKQLAIMKYFETIKCDVVAKSLIDLTYEIW